MSNIYEMTDTWNDAGTVFTAIEMDVTDTASNAASLLMDLKVGGASKFSVGKGAGAFFTTDLFEQRNGTNAQTFNIYNTYTDASNYERGFMKWASNVLEIGSEAAGTGTARTTRLSGGGNPKIEVQASDLYLKGLNADINLDNNVTINTYTYMYLQYRNGNQIRIGASDIISYVDSKFQANVEMTALPTSDPAVAGRLWNDAGTLKVSAG